MKRYDFDWNYVGIEQIEREDGDWVLYRDALAHYSKELDDAYAKGRKDEREASLDTKLIHDTFWLIERGPNQGVPQHQWWNNGPGGSVMGWKDTVHKATQFQTRDAAERAQRAIWTLADCAITSHSLIDNARGAIAHPPHKCGSACSDSACAGRCPFHSPERA